MTDVRFLGHPDGRLELTLDLRRDISRVIRQVRPQRVLTSSPERWWDRIGASHPDHMTVGESTLRAVYPDARNPFTHTTLLQDEGLEAWTVPEIWVMAAGVTQDTLPDPCPRCGANEGGTIRTRRRHRDGHEFQGCSRWPACDWSRNMPQPR